MHLLDILGRGIDDVNPAFTMPALSEFLLEFGWYLELTDGYLQEYKDLYTFPDPDELEIRQNKMRDVHDVAWRVLETVLRQMSPIVPHVAEELWQYRVGLMDCWCFGSEHGFGFKKL